MSSTPPVNDRKQRANLPALRYTIAPLASDKRLVARFVLTSAGRTVLVTATVLLMQQFLVAVLDKRQGLASGVALQLGGAGALWVIGGLLIVSYVGASLLYYDNQLARQHMVKIVELTLMERLVRHLLSLSVRFFDRSSHGDLVHAIRQDVANLRIVLMAGATILMEGAVALGLLGAADRIDQLLAERSDVAETAAGFPLRSPPRCITFEHVAFSYGNGPVLRELCFEIRAGETVGVVGPSGSGKTTLLGLVARFYDPTSGAVRFDGADLRELRLEDVCRQVAIVTQEPFLFATSVRENIRCGRPDASDAEVEAAARAADIHDEILALPLGYDTLLGAEGRILSGGQAQRINVARAILKNAPVLLLDEATSNLDSLAEARVQGAIDRLMAGRTSFIVAHRLSTVRHADRSILVLDRGAAVGLDTHEGLLLTCVLYRLMWETQLLGEAVPAPEGRGAKRLAHETHRQRTLFDEDLGA